MKKRAIEGQIYTISFPIRLLAQSMEKLNTGVTSLENCEGRAPKIAAAIQRSAFAHVLKRRMKGLTLSGDDHFQELSLKVRRALNYEKVIENEAIREIMRESEESEADLFGSPVVWIHRDIVSELERGTMSFRLFAVYAAILSIIGKRKTPVRIVYDLIQARMLGLNSNNDSECKPENYLLSTMQLRGTVSELVKRGFIGKYSEGRRAYYWLPSRCKDGVRVLAEREVKQMRRTSQAIQRDRKRELLLTLQAEMPFEHEPKEGEPERRAEGGKWKPFRLDLAITDEQRIEENSRTRNPPRRRAVYNAEGARRWIGEMYTTPAGFFNAPLGEMEPEPQREFFGTDAEFAEKFCTDNNPHLQYLNFSIAPADVIQAFQSGVNRSQMFEHFRAQAVEFAAKKEAESRAELRLVSKEEDEENLAF